MKSLRWSLFCLVLLVALHEAAAAEALRVSVQFRAGQTFITWPQPEAPGARYAVYRNDVLLATVSDHTSLNLMASIDRLKLSNTRAPAEYEMPQRVHFVIREGEVPLDARTGLFVHTAKADEQAEYVIKMIAGGAEAAAPAAYAPARVTERVEFPAPVRQNETDYVHWTDHVGTPHYPAMSSVPGVPYNFRLRAPAKGRGPHPLIGFLHGAFLQYSNAIMGGPAEASAVRIAFDSPIMRGKIKGLDYEPWPMAAWFGYNENFGSDRPVADGKVIDYTVRRVLWTLAWAERAFPIDPDRVSLRGGSMGGIGALVIGLQHPERFAAIHAHIPPLRMGTSAGSFAAMMPMVPADFLAANPMRELPYLLYTAGRTDQIVGWPDKLEFAAALRQAKAGFTFYWDLRSHDGNYSGPQPPNLDEPPVPWGRTPGRPEMSVVTFSRRQSFPALDRVSIDNDPGSVNFAVRPPTRPPLDSPGAGDFVGTFNGAVNWDRETIVDTPQRWEITLNLLPFAKVDRATASVTPRRLQQFHVEPGKSYRFRVSGGEPHEGQATADSHGRITIDRVPITKAGVRLAVWPNMP